MHLSVITELSQVAEARLSDWEEFLVEMATKRTGTEFNQAAATLKNALDDLREQRATERWQRRHLRVGARLDGMVHLEGLLDPNPERPSSPPSPACWTENDGALGTTRTTGAPVNAGPMP